MSSLIPRRPALGLLCACLLWPARAAADSVVIERVVAVVAGEPILLSELHELLVPFLQRAKKKRGGQLTPAQERELAEPALARLIQQRLTQLRAAELRISASAADVDRAVELVAEQSKVTVDELYAQALKEAGMTRAGYRENIRAQIVQARVMRVELPRLLPEGVNPSSPEADSAMQRWIAEQRKKRRVRVLVRW